MRGGSRRGHSTRLHAVIVGMAALPIIYVLLGNALHRWVFPLPAPDPATFPRAGDLLVSEQEGFHQRILDVVDGWIVSELRLEPGAIGPPMHYHRAFAEKFSVVSGTLHVELTDGVMKIGPGETYRVEPLVAHRPFNPGRGPVLVASNKPAMPQSFAACLAQLYPMLDEHGAAASLHLLLQMSVIDPICDSSLAAIPGPVQTVTFLLLAPAARLLGYRNYYPERALHPQPLMPPEAREADIGFSS